jgi:hypothetical protein
MYNIHTSCNGESTRKCLATLTTQSSEIKFEIYNVTAVLYLGLYTAPMIHANLYSGPYLRGAFAGIQDLLGSNC